MAKRGTFIGGAYVSITGDDSALGRVLGRVRRRMSKLGEDIRRLGLRMAAVGAAIQAPLAAAVKRFASLGDAVAKAAKRTGLSTEAFSELGHVAELSGSNAEELEKGLKNLAKTGDYARQGLKTYTREFDKLGVSVTDNEGRMKRIEPLFLEVAAAIGRVENETERAAVAANIFGRAGTRLIPMFQLGAEGIEHYREEARRLGISIGSRMAANAERLTDMFTRMRAAFRGIVLVVGNTLAPLFEKAQVWLTNLITNVRRWLEANPQIITGLQTIATTLLAVGGALIAIGTATKGLSVLVSPGGVLFGLAALLLYISGLLDPLIDKWGKTVLGFEVGGRKIRDWLGYLAKAWGEFVSAIKDIGKELVTVFKAVLPALAASWDLVWATAKKGFLDFLSWMAGKLRDALVDMGVMFRERAKKASILVKPILDELSGMSIEGAKGFARLVARIRGGREAREMDVEGARETAAVQWGAFGRATTGAGGRITDRAKIAVDRIAKVGQEALEPLLERIFGEKQKEKVESFFDIFRGLGRQFREFQAPAPTPAAAPAARRAGILVSGTFAGRAEAIRGATTQTSILREIATAVRGTNRILDRKLNAPGWADEEPT